MTFIDLFDNSAMVLACMIYAVFAVFEPFFELAVRRAFISNSSVDLAWQNVLAPMLRAALIIAFVVLAYPSVFGLRSAASISSLLAAPEARLSDLYSVLIVGGFIASFAPRINRIPVLALAMQACLASAAIFSCLIAYLGITTATLWPGLDVFLTMLLVMYFAYKAAHLLGHSRGKYCHATTIASGYKPAVMRVVDLLTQMPVVLLYGFGLGRQIAI